MDEWPLEERLEVLENWLGKTNSFLIEQARENMIQTVKDARDYIIAEKRRKLTDEEAIDHLHKSGWMQNHDMAKTFDSLSAVINSLMSDWNKSISVFTHGRGAAMKLPDGFVFVTTSLDGMKIGLEERELVMCRNCRHYEAETMGTGIGWCNELAIAQDGEFWCAKGEKRPDAKSDVR